MTRQPKPSLETIMRRARQHPPNLSFTKMNQPQPERAGHSSPEGSVTRRPTSPPGIRPPAAEAYGKRLALMQRFVRLCAMYNVVGAVAFLVPGSLDALGVAVPDSRFWLLLPAVFAGFVAAVLFVASGDLERYGALPFWNGLARLCFAAFALALGYAHEAGTAMVGMVVGDVVLAVIAIVGLPVLLSLSPRQLLFATAMRRHHDPRQPTFRSTGAAGAPAAPAP